MALTLSRLTHSEKNKPLDSRQCPITGSGNDTPLLRLQSVSEELHDAEVQAHVMVVTKNQPMNRILPLLRAGHRLFGENRVQAAEILWPSLKKRFPTVQLHLIGPLQTNKVTRACPLFHTIESVDRVSLVEALARYRDTYRACPDIYLQVNIGNEPQKSGVTPHALPTLYDRCQRYGLPVIGLMCIPPRTEHSAHYFQKMHTLAHTLGGLKLSMGMSGDFRQAIQHGSTQVRLGRYIYGDGEDNDMSLYATDGPKGKLSP